MSERYGTNEPATKGKVLLQTTFGELDVELWSTEAPLACRNFIQLCLEQYYDGVIFHRVVKDFMAQTGDPTGTGKGGESALGGPFKDEFHSRLRFNRAGLVAMASDPSKRNSNESQFFLSLGPCEWLNKQHTIFGKITGNTIYNALKLNETEVDESDRPLDPPPRILSAHVLSNPFDDIVVRQSKAERERELQAKREAEDRARRQQAQGPKVKDTRLVSFGKDDSELEEEGEFTFTSLAAPGSLSREDIDKKDKQQTSREGEDNVRRKRGREGQDHSSSSGESSSERDDKQQKRSSKGDRKKRRKRSKESRSKEEEKDKRKQKKRKNSKKKKEDKMKHDKKENDSTKPSQSDEYKKLREAIRKGTNGSTEGAEPSLEKMATKSVLEQRREKYLKQKLSKKDRQKATLDMLDAFTDKLSSIKKESNDGNGEGFTDLKEGGQEEQYKGGLGKNKMEDEGLSNLNDESWMRSQIHFRKHIDDTYRKQEMLKDTEFAIVDSQTAAGKQELHRLEKASRKR